MKIFDGPLVLVGGEPSQTDTEALTEAIQAFRKAGGGDAFQPFEAYLRAHPATAWKPSLQVHLGGLFRHYGYYTRALAAWQEAWALCKDLRTPEGRSVGDQALGGLMDLAARLGRVDVLQEWASVARTRPVGGIAGQRIESALEGLWVMEHQPGIAFLCGPAALAALCKAKGLDPAPGTILKATSTQKGTSLLQNLQWAEAMNMGLQAAKREPGAPILVPSLVHWKAGHYTALVQEQGGKYLLQDPTFGQESWVTRNALDDEATGYALVRAGELPRGWQAVDGQDAAEIWGKGTEGPTDGHGCGEGGSGKLCETCTISGPGPGGSGLGPLGPGGVDGGPGGTGTATGMAVYQGNIPSISLTITDTPLSYSPPIGTQMSFSVGYFQRETSQPQTFSFTNFGPKWGFSWLAYLKDDPTTAGQTVSLVWGLKGSFDYLGFNSTTQTFSSQFYRHDLLVRTGTASYELRKGDGSKEIYAASDGALTYPRRIFLSKLVDPAGNATTLTYDASMRLTTLTDALGQGTTLSYGLTGDSLKVTRITDPFGRHADFSYNAAGQLIQSTDASGIKSQFAYGATPQSPSAPVDFINSLTTPYGTATFATGLGFTQIEPNRWLEATDPLGNKERWEYYPRTDFIPGSDAQVPSNPHGQGINQYLMNKNSFYWDKRTMATYPGDYSKAKLTQFLWLAWPGDTGGGGISVLPESQKRPLEPRIWLFYPSQPHGWELGTDSLPNQISWVLDDGTQQDSYFRYNSFGKMVSNKDSLGRTTTYTYDTNGIDLLEVRNTTSINDLLAKYTYNTQHKPLTAVDAAGKTTSFSYNARGQVTSITNPKNETTTLTYDDKGYLTQVLGAVAGSTTTFGYDSAGRLTSVAPADGAVTTFEYDNLDRRTRVDYSDGTFEETVYDRLDAARVRDRAGKWTVMTYNALRQLEEVQDAEGRLTRLGWCGCGSQLESLTDPNGHTTLWVRDLQGRVIGKIYDDLSQTSYAYDSASRLQKRTDAKGQVTNYAYFRDNNLRQVSYANAQKPTPTVSYTYDANYNRLATMTDGTGTTSFAYNAIGATPTLGAGRLASVAGPMPSSTISYGYDELGRVTTRGINGVTETRAFDSLGRLGSLSNALGSFAYTYEGVTGRLSNVAYPNGQNTQFSYFDNLGQNRLKAIKNLKGDGSNLSTFGYEYDAKGQIQTWSQQADAQTPKVYSFQYDAVGQLLNATLHDGSLTGQILKSYLYGYDEGGNRTSEQIDDQVTTATFNALNQLTGQRSSAASAAKIAPKGKDQSVSAPPGRTKPGQKILSPLKAPTGPRPAAKALEPKGISSQPAGN